MTTMTAPDLASGKGHRDENFPVASALLKSQHRAPVMAFYRFARAADDVADDPRTAPAEKLRLLEAMRATLSGEGDEDPDALDLRDAIVQHKLDRRHPLDLLEAFRRDVTKRRYTDWDDLMDYCRYSAMPVGRFVLDVHGENRSTWPSNDALCAALQVINHLQDCGKDYRQLDRVYIPEADLAAHGTAVDALGASAATRELRAVIASLANHTEALLASSAPLASQIRDGRLALEVSIIQRLAESLVRRLQNRDPLSQRVHHNKAEAIGLSLLAVLGKIIGRRRIMHA